MFSFTQISKLDYDREGKGKMGKRVMLGGRKGSAGDGDGDSDSAGEEKDRGGYDHREEDGRVRYTEKEKSVFCFY